VQTFDQVYVVNHGSSGVGDQNVFDIKQNVCINIFIKNSAAQRKNRLGRVFRIDVTGNRKTKFKWLDQQTLSSVNWQEIEPKNPQFEFVKRDRVVQKEYLSGIPLNELFSKFSTSILTARDNFAVSFDENELRKRVDDFSNSDLNNGQIATKYGLKGNVAWNLDEKRRNFLDSDPKNIIQHYDYRPFDKRYIAYDDNIIQCPRKEIMQNIEGRSNIAICTCRFLSSETWNHILLTSKLVDDSFISNRSKERGQVFVLYLYHDDGTRTPNFKPETLKQFSKNLVQSYEPEDILDYIYAVLYSPKYREKYNEFLKIDFPRVPVPRNDQELHGLAGFGKQLRELHLMTSPKLNEFITTFPESGSEEIEKISYENGKVWINGQQYFENMPEIAWNFSIGSYQPAQKWLKDRKGRKLKNEDIEHYQKIIKLLTETQKIMIKINELTSF